MGLRNRTRYPEADCFFVTTTCFNWYHLLESEACKAIVCASIKFLNHKYDSDLLGYVIMPNHLHLIIYFKKANQLSNWMRDLKKFTSVKVRQHIDLNGNIVLLEKLRYSKRKQVFKVWHDRFDDVIILNSKVLEIKLNYIHLNPLQQHWNLVNKPEDWRYSSAAFYENGEEGVLSVTHYKEYF
jgi:putative transposase